MEIEHKVSESAVDVLVILKEFSHLSMSRFFHDLANLDLDYSLYYIYSFRLLFKPNSRSQNAIISKDSIIVTFSHKKP